MSVAASQDLSRHVHVLGLWSGPEYDNFATVKSAWEKQTGDRVDWQGTQDLPDALDADNQAGTPPDIAVLPNLAVMQQLAKQGKLVPLDSVLDMNQVSTDYAPPWVDLGSYKRQALGDRAEQLRPGSLRRVDRSQDSLDRCLYQTVLRDVRQHRADKGLRARRYTAHP